MGKPNPVFKENYENYLRQLSDTSPDCWHSVLAIDVDESEKSAEIPFLDTLYRVSPDGVVDDQGRCPDYGICVILLKHLLLCPQLVPTGKKWVHSRDFRDTVQAQDTGLSEHAARKISGLFSEDLDVLQKLVSQLGGKILEDEFPYDLSAIFVVLPRVPVLFLFNDKDDHFPAKTSILYESRAHHFLDAECRVMVDWYLYERLNRLKLQYSR